jgi:hypothetical protein
MRRKSNNGALGLALIGIGAALATAGVVLLVPVCASWSQTKLQSAYRRGKEGLISGFEGAADTFNDVANKAQTPLSEAAKAAKHTAAIAAGALESAAHYVRERVS